LSHRATTADGTPHTQVGHLRPGDRAVPLASAVGTWRGGGVFSAADWHAVPQQLSDAAAATLSIK
jgi:hypothetical protein